MEFLYQDLIQVFADNQHLYTDAGLTPPALIDFYMGQTERPEEFEFVLPAIFMDFSAAWRKQGNIYVADATLTFHMIPELAPDTSSISARRDEGLRTIRWYNITRYILDRLNGDHYTRPVRAAENRGPSPYFIYHTVSYVTHVDDLVGTEIGRYTEATIEKINISGQPKYSL